MLKMLKPYFKKFETMLNAPNRGFVRHAPKERSPIERSPVLNVTSSSSESIEERVWMSADANKGQLEETYRQLQEVVGISSKVPIGHVIQEVTSAVSDKFGTTADHLDGRVDQSQISEAAPSVGVNEVQQEINGDKVKDDGGVVKLVEGFGLEFGKDANYPEVEKDVPGEGGFKMDKEVPGEGNNLEKEVNDNLQVDDGMDGSVGGEGESNWGRSVGKQSLKPSSKVISPDYIGNRKIRTLGTADTNLITYCRVWSSESGSCGPIMLQCDGEFACRDACHDVVHCRRKVGTQYVSVVSKIYTNEWAIKYEGHNKRIMMHPVYEIKVICDMDTPSILAKKHGHPLRGVAGSQLAVIFVPVLKNDHWWCAAFCFKGRFGSLTRCSLNLLQNTKNIIVNWLLQWMCFLLISFLHLSRMYMDGTSVTPLMSKTLIICLQIIP